MTCQFPILSSGSFSTKLWTQLAQNSLSSMYDVRQFTNVLHTALSSLLQENEQKYLFVNLPACIVEYVFPKEMWCNVDDAKVLVFLISPDQTVSLMRFPTFK